MTAMGSICRMMKATDDFLRLERAEKKKQVESMNRIPTKNAAGEPNGWLLPLWNVREHPELRPDQVYLTAVLPGQVKGPHLHMRREQRYYLIRGEASVIIRSPEDGQYAMLGFEHGPVIVPAGTPSQIRNTGTEEAWILNMPCPAWSADDQDEHPVENWDLAGEVVRVA